MSVAVMWGRQTGKSNLQREIVEGIKHLEMGEAWEEVIEALWRIEGYLDRRGLWVEDEVVLEAG